MALKAKHKETEFGVGDVIRVTQKIKEDGKSRTQAFEGICIGIKGRGNGKSFMVRREGAQKIGIEKINNFYVEWRIPVDSNFLVNLCFSGLLIRITNPAVKIQYLNKGEQSVRCYGVQDDAVN